MFFFISWKCIVIFNCIICFSLKNNHQLCRKSIYWSQVGIKNKIKKEYKKETAFLNWEKCSIKIEMLVYKWYL